MSEWKRVVWAIKYRNGVVLIEHGNGGQAAQIAAAMFGKALGPYEVLKNQDQEILAAKIAGAPWITQKDYNHATKNLALSFQPTRRKRDARQRIRP